MDNETSTLQFKLSKYLDDTYKRTTTAIYIFVFGFLFICVIGGYLLAMTDDLSVVGLCVGIISTLLIAMLAVFVAAKGNYASTDSTPMIQTP